MYPASRLAVPDRRPIGARVLTTLAAIVVLISAWLLLVGLRPARPYLVAGGQRISGCVERFGMAPKPGDPGFERYVWSSCHTVVPPQHVAERIAVGALTVLLVGGLMVGASRTNRRPELTPA